ncbi:unnamed protein product [Amoebophrya sp. A120]|nr:unnamed protein product [Amoebophrya sp. A120]|eukprot:GSA120T00002585001.1
MKTLALVVSQQLRALFLLLLVVQVAPETHGALAAASAKADLRLADRRHGQDKGLDLRPLTFHDYDCVHLGPSPLLENRSWSEWLQIFEREPATQWITASHDFLQMIDRLDMEEWVVLRHECPYGFASFLSVYLMQCMLQTKRTYSDYDEDFWAQVREENALNKDGDETTPDPANTGGHQEAQDDRFPAGPLLSKAREDEMGCYLSFQVANLFHSILTEHPPRILFGTRWPILTILSARNLQHSLLAHDFWYSAEKNCLAIPEDQATANWPKLQRAFWAEEEAVDLFLSQSEKVVSSSSASRSTTGSTSSSLLSPRIDRLARSTSPKTNPRRLNREWYLPSLNFVFHSRLKHGGGFAECPLGYFFVEVLRSFTSMTSESRFFLAHEPMIAQLLLNNEPGNYLFTRWPFFMVFNHIRKSTRHKFYFDFSVTELLDSRTAFVHRRLNGRGRSVDFRTQLPPKFLHVTTSVAGLRPGHEPTSHAVDTAGGTAAEVDGELLDEAAQKEVVVLVDEEPLGPADVPLEGTASGKLQYLATRGSALHRNVVEVLSLMPDVWVGGSRVSRPKRPANMDDEEQEKEVQSSSSHDDEQDENHLETTTTNNPAIKQELDEDDDFATFPSPGFAYTTMVYGETFRHYLPSFIRRWKRVTGKENLLIFTFDDASYKECRKWQTGCVGGGTPGIMQKFTIPWVLALNDVDAVWVDFDVYPVQDPTFFLLQHQNRAAFEILISGSFATPCICNGIVYFRSTEAVVLWLVDVLHWMYDHPYEHDQKCFSAYLNYTEPVTMRWDQLPRTQPAVPRWDTLDPIQQFVTALVVEGNGWMGDSWRDMVLFHFLHGDSDKGSDLDSSGAWLQDSQLYANMIRAEEQTGAEAGEMTTSANNNLPSPNGATAELEVVPLTTEQKNVTLMETFYGPRSTEEKRVQALERSRQFERVNILEGMTCGVIAYPLDDLAGKHKPPDE